MSRAAQGILQLELCLTPMLFPKVLNAKQGNSIYHFKLFSMTQLGIKPGYFTVIITISIITFVIIIIIIIIIIIVVALSATEFYLSTKKTIATPPPPSPPASQSLPFHPVFVVCVCSLDLIFLPKPTLASAAFSSKFDFMRKPFLRNNLVT